MPRFEIGFGVTTYTAYVIDAPDRRTAIDVAEELYNDGHFIKDKLNEGWTSYINSGIAYDYTDPTVDEVDEDVYEITLPEDELRKYVGENTMHDIYHGNYLLALKMATRNGNWDKVAECANALKELNKKED